MLGGPLQSARILIVEDDGFLAEDIAHILEEAGARIVGPFNNMIDALENLSELSAIDGAIIDIGLGDQVSYPLAESLLLTGVPFMFLTGYPKDRLPQKFSNAPHMMKPFHDKSLIEMLVTIGVERNY